jgi:hypothetical protein
MTKRDLYREALDRIDENISAPTDGIAELVIFKGLIILALAVLAVAQSIYHGNDRE